MTTVRSGALTALVRDGQLRDVRVHGRPALEAAYVAVRDTDWGTVPARLEDVRVETGDDGFGVEFRARHHAPGLDFGWRGRIEGAGGTVVLTMDGTVEKAFLANRVGFCLLHPIELAGHRVRARTLAGPVEAVLPERISPHQPFLDLTGIDVEVTEDAWLQADFVGEVFETEDHRNWTDPGWKTYGTPLRLGFPHEFPPGRRVRQQVTLRAAGRVAAPATGPGTAVTGPVEVVVSDTDVGAAPDVGFVLVPSGADVPGRGDDRTCSGRDLAALAPGHLLVELLAGAVPGPALEEAAAVARAAGARLAVTVLVEPEGDVAAVATGLAGLGNLLARVLIVDRGTESSPADVVAGWRERLRRGGVRAAVGGGTRRFFAELNRSGLDPEDVDFVAYGICPQVHHDDEASILRTLLAQPATVRDARRIGAGAPVAVGPVSLGMTVGALPGQVPGTAVTPPRPPADPRAGTWFAAAWTVGSLAALAEADALTLHEVTGPAGVVPAPGEPPSPVQAVLGCLPGLGRGRRLRVQAPAGVAAFAARLDTGPVVLVANLGSGPQPLRLRTPWPATVRDLTEGAAQTSSAAMVHGLELPGYGVAVARTS